MGIADTIDTVTVRRIAAEAMAHPQTVRKVLRGDYVRGILVRERIVRVLSDRGIMVPPMQERHAA